MNILNIACRQFAGIKDFNAEFKPGINIVFGQNESGKSSLANLLVETLFKGSQLKKNITVDNDFIEAFFPCAVKGGSAAGNFIDGEIIFETQSGRFTLNKTWSRDNNKNAAINLVTPSGDKIIGDAEINNLLCDEFQHEAAVFREILLSPQVNNLETLNKLIRDKKALNSSGEIINTLTQLYAEAGNNIAIENIEQGINDKINTLSKNWDKLNERPRHMNHHDELSDIYRDLERTRRDLKNIQDNLNDISLLEQKLKLAEKNFNDANNTALNYKKRYEYFMSIEVTVRTFNDRNNLLNNELNSLSEKRDVCVKAMKEWPALNEKLKRAESLRSELNSLNLKEKVRRRKEFKNLINELNNYFESAAKNEAIEQDLKIAEAAENIINRCRKNLDMQGLKLRVRLTPQYKLKVTDASPSRSALQPASINENIFEYKINQAAVIQIPGVADMVLSNDAVNVKEVRAEEVRNQNIIQEIRERYNLGGVPIRQALYDLISNNNKKRLELEDYEREDKALHAEIQNLMKNLNGKLELEVNNQERGRDEIIKDINALCRSADMLDKYIGWCEAKIKSYEENYKSLEELDAQIKNLNSEISDVNIEISKLNEQIKDIKPEYLSMNITGIINENKKEFDNAEADKNIFQQKMYELKGKLESANKQAEGAAYKKIELENKFNLLQRELENKKRELDRWESILNIFNKTKEQVESNPVDHLINKFSSYLNKISDGRLEADNLEQRAQALDIRPEIYSNNKILRWLNISEGTKETIALAFRLAVINQLYQDGGAVAVFDDPLVNMDAARREKACGIIKEFAVNNQVIFLTCHEEFRDMLGGNLIEL